MKSLFKFICVSASTLSGLAALSTNALADEIRVGIMAHDVDGPDITTRALKEESVSITGEYIFDTPNWPKWTLGARPYVYGSLNLAGNTNHAGVGLNWRARFAGSFYAEFGGGLSVHDGTKRIVFPSREIQNPLTREQFIALLEPIVERRRNEIEFGSRALFRAQFAVGYDINDKWGADIVYEHLSNGRVLGSPINGGLDSVGFRVSRKF